MGIENMYRGAIQLKCGDQHWTDIYLNSMRQGYSSGRIQCPINHLLYFVSTVCGHDNHEYNIVDRQ